MRQTVFQRATWMFICILLLAAAPAQAGTPPPPPSTNDILAKCLELKVGECISLAIQTSRWDLIIAAIFLLFGVAILGFYIWGLLESLKKKGQQDADRFFTDEISVLEHAYLEQAHHSYRYFKFRGLPRAKAEEIEPPRVDKAFISVCMLPHERSDREAKSSHQEKSEDALPAEIGRLGKAEPIDLSHAVQGTTKLTIVGAAGSGKSTLLQWAGLACACSRLNLLRDLSEEQKAFLLALGAGPAPLPILIPLRAFNEYCKEKKRNRSPRAMMEFIAYYFSEKQLALNFSLEFFDEQLRKRCLLMFDGMDEVDPDDRPAVRDAVEAFIHEFEGPSLFCLVTTRYSAANISDQMVGFQRCDVQRLTVEQRDELIHLWYRSVYAEDQAEAVRKADDLCKRIRRSEKRVQDLATTPLMVTIFAMVHYSRDELPQQRAKLYEDAVEVLLSEKPYKEGDHTAGLSQWDGLDWEMRRDRLAPIAFELHQRQVESLLEDDLVSIIWQRFAGEEPQARQAARRFLQGVALRGGLLEEQDGRYGFYTHATFREYLAGRYLAGSYPPSQLPGFLREHLADDPWHEAIRLAVGYLAIKGEDDANRFVRILASLGETDGQRAQALALAGMALGDLREERRLPDTIRELTAAMPPLFNANPPLIELPLRRDLGLALGVVGDPHLKLTPLPLDMVGRMERNPDRTMGGSIILPEVVPVEGSEFWMGTTPEAETLLKELELKVYADEQPAHPVNLSDYSIGKYPVSNQEFRAFLENRGYEEKAYWSANGWLWRKGKWESDLKAYSEEFQKTLRRWLDLRPLERRSQPYWWDDPTWNAPNLPVVGICWFEAEAYCIWLSKATGLEYRLPTEAQWEKAAHGERACLWPWGDVWDPGRANTSDASVPLQTTTPVGAYPHGASLYGALDMAGNVWEWCSDWFGADEYKNRAGKEVNNPQGPKDGQMRVLRGGSWYYSRDFAHCAGRNWFAPAYFDNDLGFRVVLSPNFPPGQ